jgi:hypothetical protein
MGREQCKYEFSIKVTGRFTVYTDTSNKEEAYKAAEDHFCEADFGELEDIEHNDFRIICDGEVTAKTRGYYRGYVTARNEDDAYNKVIEKFENADFGELEDIGCEEIKCTPEQSERVKKKSYADRELACR